MAAKIYSGIKGIETPKLSFTDFSEYQKECENYLEAIKAECKKNSNSKNVGEIIKFPVADGYALYMVYSMKPLQLIHIDTMDGWQCEFAELLTPTKVTEMIERDKRIAELFSK